MCISREKKEPVLQSEPQPGTDRDLGPRTPRGLEGLLSTTFRWHQASGPSTAAELRIAPGPAIEGTRWLLEGRQDVLSGLS